MSESPNSSDDPAVVGVPPETPDEVRPSATGVVTGPLDDETDVVLADAEGGVESSTLDAPDDSGTDAT